MDRSRSLMLAGGFGLLAGLWALNFYEPDAGIWIFAAGVAVFGLGSLLAGVAQRAGVY